MGLPEPKSESELTNVTKPLKEGSPVIDLVTLSIWRRGMEERSGLDGILPRVRREAREGVGGATA